MQPKSCIRYYRTTGRSPQSFCFLSQVIKHRQHGFIDGVETASERPRSQSSNQPRRLKNLT
ncbi:predicted protein [Sclerotinia sclerotiorum 1980 UF-70]|uniref:Uncharacterized protein n=1 Tax=Sclerotinia sclerotiorum (strain ATCC 18683 / 1980 / Ss-1) TaxID=665079 RepID=A7ET81_SCLS1|nr:predicted protein [Sclerotinia sclerotiorum 1980 UF-70]EDN92673.1 predicted protein [Sclerotinia sclerotiorum 1980 UF-70]